MELRNRIEELFEQWKEGLLVLAALIGFGFVINQGVELKGLYMDDLYLWSCYGEQSFTEYVFPRGGTRFRFIFYLASWLELWLLGHHVELMVPFNIVLNGVIAYSIYRIAVSMSKRKVVSFLVAIAYLMSRFSYYQIGQFYGLMESLGLWAALGMLYYTWRYMNGRKTWTYLMAGLLYFTASFIHERYMLLVPVLLLGLLFASGKRPAMMQKEQPESEGPDGVPGESPEEIPNMEPVRAERRSRGKSRGRSAAEARVSSRRSGRNADVGRLRSENADATESGTPKWMLLLITIGIFAVIQFIRLTMIGTLSPAGTGGTDVADTFKLEDAIGHAWEQVDFVFGKNSGPDYLCGMTYEDSPGKIQNLIKGCNAVLAISVVVFVFCCVRKDRRRIPEHVKTVGLFLAFIALCIGSSSVTIRVEMRWVYVVYGAALLLLAYMSSVMGKAAVLIPLYVALLLPVETFYRETWENLYLWPEQMRYNSLAEETIEKYGEEIFDKQVYIIGNTYDMSEFTAETFLKVYDRDGDAANTTIRFIDSDQDFRNIPEKAVILWEDEADNAYVDVTEFVKHQRLNYAYGSYADGWVDEHAKIVMMNENRDVLKLGCYYPGEITGNEICQIKVNGKRMPDLVFTDHYMTYEIPSAPYQMISLEFSCNFYVKDAKEKRGEENLAMVVTLGAK